MGDVQDTVTARPPPLSLVSTRAGLSFADWGTEAGAASMGAYQPGPAVYRTIHYRHRHRHRHMHRLEATWSGIGDFPPLMAQHITAHHITSNLVALRVT